RLKRHFGDWVRGDVEVFPMPNINGFNLLLHNALGGGATKTLRYDVTGKAFSTALLRMETRDDRRSIPRPQRQRRSPRTGRRPSAPARERPPRRGPTVTTPTPKT